MQLKLPDEAATLSIGAAMGRCLPSRLVLYLQGQLGAGKTTLVRGLVQSLGYAGKVKSPTYGLVERYQVADVLIHHLDLYRLGHPEELEFIGIRDIVEESGLIAIEWPERGLGMLPRADVSCELTLCSAGRELRLTAGSDSGRLWIECLGKEFSDSNHQL